jgi:hypothetical protein
MSWRAPIGRLGELACTDVRLGDFFFLLESRAANGYDTILSR